MNAPFRLIIVMLVLCAPLQARLGETKDEIAARYGKGKRMASVFPGCELFHYNNGRSEAYVYFHDGKSVHEKIRIPEEKLTDAQIEDLLHKTSEDEHSWTSKTHDDAKKSRYWERDDQKVEAHREGTKGAWIVIQDLETLRALGISDKPDL